jgi:uncharacterized protein
MRFDCGDSPGAFGIRVDEETIMRPVLSLSRAASLASLLCLGFVVSACGSSEERAEARRERGEREFISIGTAPPGGVFFTVGGALADVLNNHAGDRNWRVTAESTGGSMENIRRLETGDIQFAMSNASITYFAVRGEAGWEKAYPARSVMTLFPNVAMFIARKDSGIRSIADLRGKRVAVGPEGAGFEYFVGLITEAHGLTFDDFEDVYAGQQQCVDLLGDGSIAAAFLGGGVPTASITTAAASMDIIMIPFGEDEKRQLIETYPFFEPATIPAGTYRGQEEDFEGLNVGSAHLITSASVPEDLVYDATRILYENRAEVAEKHAAGRAINAVNVVKNPGTEFHPGAVRYFTEIGIWPGSSPPAAEEDPEDTSGGDASDAEP